ncbi:MAG: DUF1926 domain-containing protein [Endomicrobiia bacterium]|nr:DUF1926 domain-containing protein [Endomicrobiia bacterium]
MSRTTFLLGVHNHQPVGNFPEVFEAGYRMSYRPFMEMMKRFPRLKWSLHLSGILWDFMKDKHPEYVAAAKKMCDAGRLEILSGGYYEPILAVIPDRDKLAQIKKLSAFIKNNFGQTPRGIWLTERIWEPSLPKFLSSEGIEYTLTDDYHFISAGMKEDALRGYYVTEDEGFKLNIFPISQKLRYYVPFDTVERTIELFSSARGFNSSLTMGDDGEKFGMWPKTNEHVYGKGGDIESGWLFRFFSALSKNSSWLDTNTFSGFMDAHRPTGRVYLPSASYFEMSEWTLPPASQLELENLIHLCQKDNRFANAHKFLRGGFWRNFLTKYSESNNMHKKMLRVSERIASALSSSSCAIPSTPKTAARFVKAAEHLYAAQCNCAYWHGVFGGLYLPHLRKAVYEELILAEKALAPRKFDVIVSFTDIDKDGRDEIAIEGKSQNLYLSPARGGCLYEWDVYEPASNMLNVLTRRYEAYHEKIKQSLPAAKESSDGASTIHGIVKMKEKNLERYLNYDWYDRASLLDHFFGAGVSLEDFRECRFKDLGDFTLEPYTAEIIGGKITLRREGTVRTAAGARNIVVEKTLTPSAASAGFTVAYKITNASVSPAEFMFGSEFNLAFFAGFPSQEISSSENLMLNDKVTGLTFVADVRPASAIWLFPVETVSLSEDGFERTLQGGCVLFARSFRLKGGASDELSIAVSWTK